MRVVKQREDGIVRRVVLFDDRGDEVEVINRFLSHLADSGYSPNTVCAYGYDLRHLVRFLDQHAIGWNDFRPSTRWSSWPTCGGCRPGVRRSGLA